MPAIQVITAPTALPVSLADMKLHLRVDISDDDALISDLLQFATDFVAEETEQQIMPATLRLYLDRFPRTSHDRDLFGWAIGAYNENGLSMPYQPTPRWRKTIYLPNPPLVSVSSVNYLASGTATILDPSVYTVDAVSRPGRIVANVDQPWPDADPVPNAVWVDFICGYASPPAKFVQSVKWMVAHCYEHREGVSELTMSALPMALQATIESLMFREAYGA